MTPLGQSARTSDTVSGMGSDPATLPRTRSYDDAVRERLRRGERLYGRTGYSRPAAELLEEIAEELVDVGGWAAILRDVLLAERHDVHVAAQIQDTLREVEDLAAYCWARLIGAVTLVRCEERHDACG